MDTAGEDNEIHFSYKCTGTHTQPCTVYIATVVNVDPPSFVDKRVWFDSHDCGNEIFCVVSACTNLNQTIHCSTDEHEASCTHKSEQTAPHIDSCCHRSLSLIKGLDPTVDIQLEVITIHKQKALS